MKIGATLLTSAVVLLVVASAACVAGEPSPGPALPKMTRYENPCLGVAFNRPAPLSDCCPLGDAPGGGLGQVFCDGTRFCGGRLPAARRSHRWMPCPPASIHGLSSVYYCVRAPITRHSFRRSFIFRRDWGGETGGRDWGQANSSECQGPLAPSRSSFMQSVCRKGFAESPSHWRKRASPHQA